MRTARVNLTIPGPVDDLLTEMAAVTGQSKSSLVASILTFQMPRLRQWLDTYRVSSDPTDFSLTGMDLPAAPKQADPKRSGPAQHGSADKRAAELTRQQRRALEREEAKKKRRGG